MRQRMEFRAVVDDVLDGYYRHYPVHATEIGHHAFDGVWPDLTAAGRSSRLAWLAGAQSQVEGVAPTSLSRDEAIDRRILLDYLAAARFDEETLDEGAWNALSYVYLFGNGLFLLLAREFAPPADRLRAAASRMGTLPVALGQARRALTAGGGRPISQFHTEKAVERMLGLVDLVDTAVEEAAALDDRALGDDVGAAAEVARTAIRGFSEWLRDELLPGATGDFRLGAELYAQKFRHSLKTDLTPAQLEQRAASAYDEVRAEMLRLAHELWPAWLGNEPLPDDEGQTVRRVLDAIAVDHPRADELLDFCRAENARIEAFIADHDLVGLADEPLQIVWTPRFLRAFGGAMLIPPGPLDRGLDSFFAITPMPDEWSEERRESFLREDNARMLRLLTIHEAVPGHYLQLAYSNRTDSLVRSIFQSGVFAEGWAVYITQVMMDVGYGADDPALMLVHWKFYLRAITNTLMDLRIHAGSMTEQEAMTLMVEGGFQEEGEATNKWDRARLSSTQLCEYFLGSIGMHDLEAEARRRAVADGREFAYRPFLELVLAHGTPSLPVIRDILFPA
ncbi:MAG TPA: DUF885 domain-containing protein [Candidatus Limnocylindrales bacterium]|nr:DUF885 domain-containing protein [Candidatus Limnocylindrales bacterium]